MRNVAVRFTHLAAFTWLRPALAFTRVVVGILAEGVKESFHALPEQEQQQQETIRQTAREILQNMHLETKAPENFGVYKFPTPLYLKANELINGLNRKNLALAVRKDIALQLKEAKQPLSAEQNETNFALRLIDFVSTKKIENRYQNITNLIKEARAAGVWTDVKIAGEKQPEKPKGLKHG